MSTKGLKNAAAAILLASATIPMGIGVLDASVPERCTIYEEPESKNVRVCSDNVDGDAQDWIKIALVTITTVGGLKIVFPSPGEPGSPPIQSPTRGNRRLEDRKDEE